MLNEFKELMGGFGGESSKDKRTISTGISVSNLIQSQCRLIAENPRYRSSGNIRRVNSHYFKTLFSKSRAAPNNGGQSQVEAKPTGHSETSWFVDQGHLTLNKTEVVAGNRQSNSSKIKKSRQIISHYQNSRASQFQFSRPDQSPTGFRRPSKRTSSRSSAKS